MMPLQEALKALALALLRDQNHGDFFQQSLLTPELLT
jgi:hypothetical protein